MNDLVSRFLGKLNNMVQGMTPGVALGALQAVQSLVLTLGSRVGFVCCPQISRKIVGQWCHLSEVGFAMFCLFGVLTFDL